jgi:ribonucleoside-triphosphate reductase
LQAAPRRVKTIYSVIASPQRLEILKILNVKGPLTYSALKTLAGFKSKKESGKFAYHLRKLVRQLLIQLNRQERKYTVTNLGRLVLNLTRQIEEQSLVESGKLYVRTSRQAMEEFNADKILQSLVKEAGMPVELAQKITSETESRLYKFQTQYLTAPLIREMVNSLLVEHNLEEYRHKLTRLGLPVYDVTQLLGRAGEDGSDVESLLYQTGKSVFSEYLLLEQIPRDVADAHLAGDIHIADAGSWGLTPDTIFIDLLSVRASGFNPKGRLPYAPMIPTPEGLESAMSIVSNITSLIRREASVEVVYRNFLQYLAPFTRSKTKHEVVEAILRFLDQASSQSPASQKPTISLELDPYVRDDSGRELVDKTLDATLEAYRALVEQVPRPEVRLNLARPKEEDGGFLKDAVSAVFAGGRVAFFQPGLKRSFLGVNPDLLPPESQGDHVSVLHNLGLNLPRLSYESNQDETYFRAKLAMLIGVASDALTTRRRVLERVMKKGLLPTLTFGSEGLSSDAMPLVMNLVGLEEALSNLTKDASLAARGSIAEKVIQTASQVAAEKSGKNERLGVAMIEEEGAQRLAALDAEKYGRASLQQTESGTGYSLSPRLSLQDLQVQEKVDYVRKVAVGLTGGISVVLDASASDMRGTYQAILASPASIPAFRVHRAIAFCRNCGAKLPPDSGRCKRCRSTATTLYSTAQ